ncbi:MULTISPECIES: phosphoserine transaminase [unclassified Hyphomicrobium]|uniref:phosphoserine transaminase n=1 Tax=unclassified Hyphomicrobium TaxID=2619925 RepID=UPI000213F419|nr:MULTISPECIES: phosphoserine transaminase [unclassified Hyphomicrobium]CCB64263.1 phosphoserine aminotransferase [Hyphomicrobium sp. MC1]
MPKLLKPKTSPERPFFSSGPCAKRPGWRPDVLCNALVGRSHRSMDGRERLKLAVTRTHELLRLPPGYEVAIVPGSDTGAFEMAMWNLLGQRGVDVLAWDVFGRNWLRDATSELKLADLRTFEAEPGYLPDLGQVDFSRDVLFTWNGTTTGVRVPDANWIASDRDGLVICDATSALLAEEIDFQKIDVLTYSWQKVLGGEGAHGMLILSPRALERLETHRPPWPVPKLFRLWNADGVLRDVFEGVTLNTPSMLCVEDYLDALAWATGIGGLEATIARADANAALLYDWIERTDWIAPLAVDPQTRSHTSVAMRFAEPQLVAASESVRADVMRTMVQLLEAEAAAFDIAAYRGMPPGLRIWCGATVETQDIAALLPWLDWAYAEARAVIAA